MLEDIQAAIPLGFFLSFMIGPVFFVLLETSVIILLKKSKEDIDDEAEEIIIPKNNYLRLSVKGFFLNFINIGVLVFWLGVIIVVGPSLDNDPSRFVIFFGTMMGSYFATDLVKILLAKQLKKKLTPTRIIKVKKLLGLILVICGIVLISKGFLPKDQLNPQDIIEEFEQIDD